MKSVHSERQPDCAAQLERRELPTPAGRAVFELARAIQTTLDRSGSNTADLARTLNDPVLIEQIDTAVSRLPAAVRELMAPPATASGAAIISRLPLHEQDCGPTPADWQQAARWSGDPSTRAGAWELDIAMLLLARAAGDPFGWQGQQEGRLVNNILPAVGHEQEQSGASSTTLLSPHTEDAFHPHRAHLLLLGCLRNHDRIGTTVSSVRHVRLTPRHRQVLSTPTLPILPDVSYGSGYDQTHTTPVPTLWHDNDRTNSPATATLRYDPAYTPLPQADPEFQTAYATLTAELSRVCMCVALDPGELLLVDNDVVVHGRVPFTARYDGTDRWLKRVNIRLPERQRRAEESGENGYGQRVVAPFSTPARHRPQELQAGGSRSEQLWSAIGFPNLAPDYAS